MPVNRDEETPSLSVILPANNEEALIAVCLRAVLASDWESVTRPEVIVIANGCQDKTAESARRLAPQFAERGWTLKVEDLHEGGKLLALNHGDSVARAGTRVYLDADVEVSPGLLMQLHDALDTDKPRYASGQVVIPRPQTLASRAYARIYRQVPFMTHGVPGCGVFAVNAAGRARWGTYPDIISDDTFVRLNFAATERIGVKATYSWPIVEGLKNLIKVRRRQNIGVDQVAKMHPELMMNDDKPPFPALRKLGLALRDPIGFAVYSGVALIVKLTSATGGDWSRGR